MYSSQQPYEVGTTVIPTLQIRRLRPKEVQWIAPGYTAVKGWSQGVNLGSPLLFISLLCFLSVGLRWLSGSSEISPHAVSAVLADCSKAASASVTATGESTWSAPSSPVTQLLETGSWSERRFGNYRSHTEFGRLNQTSLCVDSVGTAIGEPTGAGGLRGRADGRDSFPARRTWWLSPLQVALGFQTAALNYFPSCVIWTVEWVRSTQGAVTDLRRRGQGWHSHLRGSLTADQHPPLRVEFTASSSGAGFFPDCVAMEFRDYAVSVPCFLLNS